VCSGLYVYSLQLAHQFVTRVQHIFDNQTFLIMGN